MMEDRPYQQRIIEKTVSYLKEGGKSIMIESATGCLAGDSVIIFNLGGKSKRITIEEAFFHFHGGDPGFIPDSGLCECGCGMKTKIPTKTDKSKGQIGGRPLRFIHGHQGKIEKWQNKPRVRSLLKDRIGLHDIQNVIRSGLKDVFTLCLTDGKQLTATSCHPIMTSKGWITLGDLQIGDLVMCE